MPILEQLQLEEALLRTTQENYCLINHGASPAIVLGISSNPEKLVNLSLLQETPIPLIKRFSGGGTVVIDENTLFVTLLFNKKDLPCEPYPEPVLRWSADLYSQAWQIPHFALKENDYVIEEKKCGGNAQYIVKDRFLHHTSFLFDFCPQKMLYLSLPEKRPSYREDRDHEAFLTPLKHHLPSKTILIKRLKETLERHFTIETVPIPCAFEEHRKATKKLC